MDLDKIIQELNQRFAAPLPARFLKLAVGDLADTEIFPCINEVILIKIMTEISDDIIDVDAIKNTVEKRRTCVWYEGVRDFYEGILLKLALEMRRRVKEQLKKLGGMEFYDVNFSYIDLEEHWEDRC